MSAAPKKMRRLTERNKANINFWRNQFKQGKVISIEEETTNLIRAVEFGLSNEATFSLTAELLIQLHPMVQRSRMARNWVTCYKVAVKRGSMLGPKREATLCNQLGALYWRLGRNAAASIEFENARQISLKQNLFRHEAAALLGITMAKWAAHDFESAFLEARKAVRRLRNKLSGDILLGRLLAAKGVAAYAASKFSISKKSFKEAMKLRGWEDLGSQVQFQINIALIDSRDKALYAGEKRLKKLADNLNDKAEAVFYLRKIELLRAVLSQNKGDFDVALIILERALNTGLLIGSDDTERAWAESVLGRILWRGEPKKARVWLKSASLLWEKLGDPWLVLDTLRVLDQIGTE